MRASEFRIRVREAGGEALHGDLKTSGSNHAPPIASFISGFTLLELSIVVVIIGLLLGATVVGGDLIDAAAVRSQIAQINKYNSAVSTFQNKYNYLPGDIPNPYAANAGFQSRGSLAGQGDGNGLLEANCTNAPYDNGGMQIGCGELAVFWQDLSTAGLIDVNVPTGTNQPNIVTPISGNCCISVPANPGLLTTWLPSAKLGNGQYVYIMSVNSINYFVVQKVRDIGWSTESTSVYNGAANAMTVQQAYNIDQKTDDGLPQSGSVIACDADGDVNNGNGGWYWAAGSSHQGVGGTSCSSSTTAATTYQTYNCYDNNGVAGTQKYSTAKNGNIQNCALSFAFQ